MSLTAEQLAIFLAYFHKHYSYGDTPEIESRRAAKWLDSLSVNERIQILKL